MTLETLEVEPAHPVILRIGTGEPEKSARRMTIRAISAAIGKPENLDTVILRRDPMIVMIVDDTGMLDHRPVNQRATDLAREAFGDHYPYCIHGDVAIAYDSDFGRDVL